MAKNSNRSSTKAALKHAGIQRGIGNKTSQQLQDAAAAIKAQTNRHGLICVPKPAKAAVDNDASSVPHCMSEGHSSDLNPSTPELVSPRGLSTGSFEKDGPASCASSTSEDEWPVSSEPCCNNEEILDDLEEFLHDKPDALDLPYTAQENTITMTGLLAAKVPALIHKKSTWELLPEAQEGGTAGRASEAKALANCLLTSAIPRQQLERSRKILQTLGNTMICSWNTVGTVFHANESMLQLEPWKGQNCTLENTLHIKDLPRDTAPRPSASQLREQVRQAPHQREHYDVFLEHCAVEAKGGTKLSIEEELMLQLASSASRTRTACGPGGKAPPHTCELGSME
ncbi:g9780 [Coccomyxa elongata]